MRRIPLALLASLALLGALPARALAGPPAGFALTTVASGLTQPTAFALAPDGRIFVAEKAGYIRVVDNGVVRTFLDLRADVNTAGDRGLIGIALDPSFATDPWVYVSYTEELTPATPDSGSRAAGGAVLRVRASAADPDVADSSTRQVILRGFANDVASHSIGGIRFDPAGNLLLTHGDGANWIGVDPNALRAQDLDSGNGKLLRIDRATGAGVPGNPFYDAAAPQSWRSRVLARGFRNPFRFTVDAATDTIWLGDVGWSSWEEVDRIPLTTPATPLATLNFGWPCYEGSSSGAAKQPGYASDATTRPTCLATYTPAEGGTGLGSVAPAASWEHDPLTGTGDAAVAGPLYRGSAYPGAYLGKVFFGDYAADWIKLLDPATGTVTPFGTAGGWGNPVDLQLGTDGRVYLASIATGEIRRLDAVGDNRPPVVAVQASVDSGGVPLATSLTSTGTVDPDGDAIASYAWDFGDGTPGASGPAAAHEYATAGRYVARLTVTDVRGAVGEGTVEIEVGNTRPVVSFVSPLDGQGYAVGEHVPVALAASDAEDGELPASAVTWQVILHHLGHLHYDAIETGTSGAFDVDDHGDESYIEVRATAEDASGARGTASVILRPRTTRVTISTSPGAPLIVDGQPRQSPYAWDSIVGGSHRVIAADTTPYGVDAFPFAAWSVPAGIGSATGTTADFVTPASGPVAVSGRYATAVPAGNRTANPSLETSLTGWTGWNGSLTRVADASAPHGGFVMQVLQTAGSSYTIDDAGATITNATGGQRYTARAYVKAATPASLGKSLAIRLREKTSTGSTVRTTLGPAIVLSDAWQPVTATATTASTTTQVEVLLVGNSSVDGPQGFRADLVTLVGQAQPPSASFSLSPASPTAGTAVTFTDTSTDADGTIAARAWDLDGDGQYVDGTGATATRTFASAGSYTVGLRVTDSSGLTATTTRTVVVGSTGGGIALPAGNLTRNATFETDASGWMGWQSTLAREAAADAPQGSYVVRVTRSTGTSYSIDDNPTTVTGAAAGAVYAARVYVKAGSASAVGKRVYLRIREKNGATQVGEGSASVLLTTAYQRIDATRTVAQAGSTVEVYVLQSGAVAGDAFLADVVSLVRQ